MAYVPQQIPDEEKNQFGSKNPTTPNPVPPQTGGSSGAAAQGGGPAAPGVGTSTQFGSNAAKLSDYLKANAPQVQDFGNKVAGNLTGQYNQAMGAVDTGFGDFNTQVNQGYAQPNQELVKQAAANPTEFAKNPENVKGFQSQYNNSYTGPQNFESSDSYGNINNQVNKAVQDAGLTKSASGLGSYLNNYMGTGTNTPGMQTLDTALLQRSPEASQAIQNAAKPFSGLTDYFSGKTAAANQNVANAKQTADANRADVQGQFNSLLPNLQNDINSRVSNQQGQATSELTAMNDLIARGNLSPEELSALGIDQGQYNNLFSQYDQLKAVDPYTNFSPANYFSTTPNPAAVTPGEVATPDEYARAAALSQLTGQQSFLNPNEMGTSGTAPIDTNFNINDAMSYLQNELKRFKPPPTGGGGTNSVGFGGGSSKAVGVA